MTVIVSNPALHKKNVCQQLKCLAHGTGISSGDKHRDNKHPDTAYGLNNLIYQEHRPLTWLAGCKDHHPVASSAPVCTSDALWPIKP